MPAVAPLGVDGLIGGDRVEPGPKPPAFLELLPLEVYLQKRCLKHVLRHLGATEIATEITKQLLFITMHQRLERGRVAVQPTAAEEFLVGKPAAHGPTPLNVGRTLEAATGA